VPARLATLGALGVLLAKLLLAPACVAAASLAARRWGPRAGGLLGGLPVIGAPIILVLVLEHGADFGARAGAASLIGLLPTAVFVVVYGRLATRFGPVACVLAGWTAFLVSVAALASVEVPRGLALAIVFAGFWAAARLLPDLAGADPVRALPPTWDLPVRMTAAGALVLLISVLSSSLGAHVSGLLAPFPVLTAVLAGFTHRHGGAAPVEPMLRGFLLGYYGFAAFCFAVSLTLTRMPTGPAFALALAAAPAAQLAVLALGEGRMPVRPAVP
jgi:hypothetical protein